MNLLNSHNKMKITYREFGLGKECKNPLELTDSQKILHEEDRKHIAGACKIQQSHEMRLKNS